MNVAFCDCGVSLCLEKLDGFLVLICKSNKTGEVAGHTELLERFSDGIITSLFARKCLAK